MALSIEVCDGVTGALCDAATSVVGGVGSSVFDAVFVALGAAFVASAQDLVAATLATLDASTRVDLSAGWFSDNMGVLAAVSLPVLVGLFVVQVIGAVLRREPGGLVRALVGVGKATVGAAVAIAATKVALTATDEICAAIAESAGTSVTGAARRFLDLTWLAGPGTGPVLQMLLASAVMVGVMLLWGVLLFRKAAILLVAVFAPSRSLGRRGIRPGCGPDVGLRRSWLWCSARSWLLSCSSSGWPRSALPGPRVLARPRPWARSSRM